MKKKTASNAEWFVANLKQFQTTNIMSDSDILEMDKGATANKAVEVTKAVGLPAGSEKRPSPIDRMRKIGFNGANIRPVTLATFEMLRLVGSPLISGVKFEDKLDLLPSCIEFMFIHTAPEEDTLDYVLEDDPKKRRKVILRWSMAVKAGDMSELVDSVVEALKSATETQATGKYPNSKKDSSEGNI